MAGVSSGRASGAPGARVAAALVAAAGAIALAVGDTWPARNAGVVALLCVLFWLWRGGAGQWIGAWLAEPAGRRRRPRAELVGELVGPLFVTGAVLGAFHRILLGDAPVGGDHPIHLFQGWVMAEHLLPSGRLSGWVNLRGAGYPAGVLYPGAASLLIALVRFATPASVTWDQAYGIAFLLAMLVCHLSIYASGRLVGGPWVGLLAGCFSVVDVGAYRQSGWHFAVSYGVWPTVLSMSLAVVGVLALHRALLASSRRGGVLAAILVGASLLVHPMAVAFLALALPAAVGHAALEAEGPRPLWVVVRGAGFSALGVALAGCFLGPFIALSESARTLGTGAVALRSQARGLVDLGFFEKLWTVPAAAALIGGFVAWRSKLPAARLLTLLLVGLALVTNGTTLTGLDVERLWSHLSNVQPDRFYLFLRPMAYVLAGVGIVAVLRFAGTAVEGPMPPRRWLVAFAACAIFGSYLVPVAETFFWEVYAVRAGWRGRGSGWRDYMATARFIKRDAARRGGILRSTWDYNCGEAFAGGTHCFESSPAFTGIGHLHTLYASGASFDGLFDLRGDPETLEVLGVRYRVTTKARPGETALFASGPLKVYEVAGVAEQPFTVRGDADVRLLQFEDELVRFRVGEAAAGARLTLHVAAFERWRATIDGREVPIERRQVGSVRALMDVPLSEGELVFRYTRGAAEHLGWVVSLAALLICLGLVLPIERVSRLVAARAALGHLASSTRAHRIAIYASLAVATAIATEGVVLWMDVDRPPFDTLDAFDRAHVWYVKDGRRERCGASFLGERRCGKASFQWVGPQYVWTDIGRPRGAIAAQPMDRAILHVDYPEVTLGRVLEGGMGVTHDGTGRAPVRLRIRAAGRQIFQRSFVNRQGWDSFSIPTTKLAGRRARLEFIIDCRQPAGRKFVFRAWVPRPGQEKIPPSLLKATL